jgi:(p)ppGpp synthase/HD superfamily hydrolase
MTMDVDVARQWALRAHGAQRYGEDPYVVHLDEVVAILKEFGWSEPEVLAAGYLHDVVEDTAVTQHDVVERLGERVAHMVAFCTDEEGPDRATRKQHTYARMRAVLAQEPTWGAQASAVKLADRLANVRRCVAGQNARLLAVYSTEHSSLMKALGGQASHQPLWDALAELLG